MRTVVSFAASAMHLTTLAKRPSSVHAVDVQSQLIEFRSDQVDMGSYVNDKKTKQPSLVCIGCVDNPDMFFLMVNLKCLPLNACDKLRAIDALFKTHFVNSVD